MSSDILPDAVEGVTKGVLSWGEEKIKQLAEKFRNKELAFIQEKEVIEKLKETKNSGELAFYKTYIKDKEILFIVRLGLTLRKFENNAKILQDFKLKIKKKYEIKGLHIAYFVQNGLLNRYVGILLDDLASPDKLNETICKTLQNIEKHTVFVDWRYNESQVLKESMTITSAHKPDIFIVSGVASAAKIVRDCEPKLAPMLLKYELEKISTGKKEVLFFKYTL